MMKNLTYFVDKEALTAVIHLEKFLRKYTRERSRKKVLPLYEKMMAEVATLAVPNVVFDYFSDDLVRTLNVNLPKKADGVVLAVCTLGKAVDERYFALVEEDELALTAVLDEIALAWIVALTKSLHQSIREQAKPYHLKVGPAYRPGIGRLPIDLQKIIFKTLPVESIDVSLSEELVMHPIRSTSLIMPVFNINKDQSVV